MRLVATLALLLLAAPVAAQPYLYWATGSDDSIARSDLDGSNINTTFINQDGRGSRDVVTDGTFLYWTNPLSRSIGRANLDGSGVDPEFITLDFNPAFLTLDDTYLYWSAVRRIGRARLDGSEVNKEFIPDVSASGNVSASGLAVSGTHIYWATGFNGTIGRANIDGTGLEESFVGGLMSTTDVLVAGGFLYWTEASQERGIGRVGLDGSNPELNFIPEVTFGQGLASDGNTLYITQGAFTIATANLDGSGYSELISGFPTGVKQGLTVGGGMGTSNAPAAAPDAALRLSVAPNPAHAEARLTVETEPGSAVRVAVYDALGREVAAPFAGTFGAERMRTIALDTDGLPAGLYVVRVESGDRVETKKLTVVR